MKPVESSLKTRFQGVWNPWNSWKHFGTNPLETLWKLLRNPLQTLWKLFRNLWKLFRNPLETQFCRGVWNPLKKPFWNPVSPKLPCFFRRVSITSCNSAVSSCGKILLRASVHVCEIFKCGDKDYSRMSNCLYCFWNQNYFLVLVQIPFKPF